MSLSRSHSIVSTSRVRKISQINRKSSSSSLRSSLSGGLSSTKQCNVEDCWEVIPRCKYEQHVLTQHPETKEAQSIRSDSLSRSKSLKKPIQALNTAPSFLEKKIHRCETCGRSLTTKQGLKGHMQTHGIWDHAPTADYDATQTGKLKLW